MFPLHKPESGVKLELTQFICDLVAQKSTREMFKVILWLLSFILESFPDGLSLQSAIFIPLPVIHYHDQLKAVCEPCTHTGWSNGMFLY